MLGGAAWGGIAGLLKANRRARGDHDDHAQLHRARFLGYLLSVKGFQAPPYGQAISNPVVKSAQLPAAARQHVRVHGGLILALLAAVLVGWLLDTQHARLPAARGRREPVRRAYRRHERRAQLHRGDADRRRAVPGSPASARSSAPTASSPKTSTPASASTRITVALLGRATEWHHCGRSAVRRAPRRRHPDAVGHRHPDRPRAGDPVADRAVHRGPDADPRRCSGCRARPARSAGSWRRDGTDDRTEAQPADELIVEHVADPAPGLAAPAARAPASPWSSSVLLTVVAVRHRAVTTTSRAAIQLGRDRHCPRAALQLPAVPVAWVAGVVIVLLGVVWLVAPQPALAAVLSWARDRLFVIALMLRLALRQRGDLPSTSSACSPARSACAVPLILGALCRRDVRALRVINVAIEGQMLAGAWTAALIGTLVGSHGIGLVAGALAGALIGCDARGLRDPLPGQPGGPRRGAQRVRGRPDRLPLRRLHAAARRDAQPAAAARHHQDPAARRHPGDRAAASSTPTSSSTSPTS